MNKEGLKFVISHDAILEKKEEEMLIEAYRQLFIQLYNYDIVDSFLKVTNISANELLKNKKVLLKLADNYIRAINAIEEVKSNEKLDLFLIYDSDDKLLGGGRLYKISNIEASIPDIAIVDVSNDNKREIWRQAVIFAESYFAKEGITKMYIEIPLNDGPLLVRADNMGYSEDPDDIIISETTRTYLLNKSLERKRNVKSNNCYK